MAECIRGHVRVADRQRRCIECRRGYDRARAGTEERLRSKRRWNVSPGGRLTGLMSRSRLRMAVKAEEIARMEAQLV